MTQTTMTASKQGGGLAVSKQAIKDLRKGLKNVEKDLVGAMTILKYAKGDWTYGTTRTEVDKTSLWMVDPFSFVHGYIAWGGERPVEHTVSMLEPLPQVGAPPPESLVKDADGNGGHGWQRTTGLSLKCVEGPDKDTVARFTTSSDGGRKAVKALLDAIDAQLDVDEDLFVPLVYLDSDHYIHPDKTRGKIHTPVFEVVRWTSVPDASDDVSEDEQVVESLPAAPSAPDEAPFEVEPEPEPAPEPERRRRRRA